MAAPFSSPTLDEAHACVERAMGGLHTLHVGPLDHNVFRTADDLRMAAKLLELFEQECAEGAKTKAGA